MGGVAELLLTHHDPAQEPVRGVLLGEGDAAEDLQRAVGDLAGAASDVRLGHHGRPGSLVQVVVEGGGHVEDRRPHEATPTAITKARSRRCAPAAATTSISAAIIEACFELAIEPHRVAKLSGIGCSSKTPDYFLGQSHGFNSVHGRMPSVLTGANLANRDLIYLGVSGDGDSASIGLGQFAHAIRRGVNMVYIVENNGVYGLTKGQFSATADRGSKSKRGVDQQRSPIDLVAMALQLGATFVARRFSGDKEQLVPLIKAAIEHQGAAFIDVLSALRRLQQSPRLDQELRLRAQAQRGGEPARFHHRPRADHGRLRARARWRSSSSMTARRSCCASSTPSTISTTARAR